MNLAWGDILCNGMPGYTRALEQIQRAITVLENQQAMLSHRLGLMEAAMAQARRDGNRHVNEIEPAMMCGGTAGGVVADSWVEGDGGWVREFSQAVDGEGSR